MAMLLLAALSVVSFVAAQCPSGQKTALGGLWSNPSAWCPSGVPANNDNVEIPEGVDMLVDVSTSRLGWVLISAGGKLRFDDGKGVNDVELLFQAETILDKGYLEMGRPSSPLTRPVRVSLLALSAIPSRPNDMDVDALFVQPYGKKMIAVVENGIWDAHASGRQVMWTKLSATVPVGASSISLIQAVDWKVGDQIIVTSTDFSPDETERRFVSAVSTDKLTVTLDMPLNYSHYGVSKIYAGFNVDMRGEVGVLTSNFVIEGDMTNFTYAPEPFIEQNNLVQYVMFGGHTVSVDNSFVRLEGLEFRAMGQGGRLARYPVHWHHRGYAPGQYMKRCAVHDTFSRAITVHDTKQLLIENTVSFNVYGHAIYLEDGTEELNQFYNNLVVTSLRVGKGSDDVMTGSWKFPECGTPQPGLRLQYLDYEPSGFWITSVNNTFVGNVAVGHDWGFWIRVDFVFQEPLYPNGCTVCCPNYATDCNCTVYWRNRDHPERVINKASTGLIFVDNVAHSNIQAGWWVKENWLPDPKAPNIIDGFLTYKNLVGMDNYGVADLNFTRIIAADNAGGMHIDWVRTGQATFSNSLFIGESENHGNYQHINPYNNQQMAGTPTASLVFPLANRTFSQGMSNLGQYCLRMGDAYHHMHDIVFFNCRRPSAQWSSFPYTDDYNGYNYLGSLTFHTKTTWASPDRDWSGLYWVNSDPPSRLRGTKISTASKMDATTPPYLTTGGSGESVEYGSGFHDVDGSFPCSQPGAWWLNHNVNGVPPECEFRNASNMYYCPPGDYSFRHLLINTLFAYANSGWPASSYPVFNWDCGKTLHSYSTDNYYRRFTLHTKKHYVMSMMQSDGVTEVTYASLGDSVGLDFQFLRGDVFEGMDLVVRVPGTWQSSYYLRRLNGANPLLVDAPASYLQTSCVCGVTYAKITTKGNKDGPWPGPRSPVDNLTAYFPDYGWELHLSKNASVSCPSSPCGNPFAVADPANCNTPNRHNIKMKELINNADPTTACTLRTPPTALRPWATRPPIINYPVPSDYVFPDEAALSGATTVASMSALSALIVFFLI